MKRYHRYHRPVGRARCLSVYVAFADTGLWVHYMRRVADDDRRLRSAVAFFSDPADDRTYWQDTRADIAARSARGRR